MNFNDKLRKIKILKSIINKLVPIKKLRKQLRQKVNDKFLPDIVKSFIEELETQYKDYWIFTTFWPWGDFIMSCTLLDSFKQKHGGKILVLYEKDSQLEFIKTFNFADETLKIPPELYYAFCTNTSYCEHNKYGLTKGHIYEMSHHVFKEADINKSSNFMELYRKMFQLQEISFKKLVIPLEIKKRMNDYYNNISQDCPVILITPDAHSYNSKEISIEFWENLVSRLQNAGYKVIFNTKRKDYEKFDRIFLPLLETCYLATLCELNISIRSGFTDIITIMGADNQIILYPKSMKFITISEEALHSEIERCFNIESEITFEETMFNVTSINNMFNKEFLELVVQDEKNNIEEIIDRIKIKEKI